MAKALPLVLVLVALGGAGCGDRGAGHLVAEPDTVRFGRVIWKDTAEERLVLRNEGPRAVLVTDVVPNCACFEVPPFRRTLQPGEEREIRVLFVSERVPPVTLRGKKLEVLSDDPEAPHLEVKLEGDPYATHAVTPPELSLGPLDAEGRTRRWKVQIRPAPDVKLEAGPVTTFPPDVLEVATTRREGELELEVGIQEGASAGTALLKGWIAIPLTITLADGKERTVREVVRVRGEWP